MAKDVNKSTGLKRLKKIEKTFKCVAGIVSAIALISTPLELTRSENVQTNVDQSASAAPAVPLICPKLEEFKDDEERLAYAADLLNTGKHQTAVTFLSNFLATVEQDSHLATTIYYDRGLAHLYLKEYHLAVSDLSKVVKQAEYADAYYNIGNALVGLERYEDAIEQYKQAQQLKQKPEYEAAQNMAEMKKNVKKSG